MSTYAKERNQASVRVRDKTAVTIRKKKRVMAESYYSGIENIQKS